MGIVAHIKNLLKGMGITSKHLARHAITIQYPEEKMEMFEGSRGVVVLLSDKETGELNCTACALCEKACPTRAITIKWHRDDKKRKHLDGFVIDFGLCCYCGLCEESCNFCAIKMANKYEFSTWDKDDITWDVNKLQEVGRDVPYEDTRKKKKPKQAAPASSAVEKDAKVAEKEATPPTSANEAAPADAKKEATPESSASEKPPADVKKEATPPAPEAPVKEKAPADAPKEATPETAKKETPPPPVEGEGNDQSGEKS